MHPSLLPYLKALSEQLETLAGDLAGCSHEELSAKPSSGAWSVLDIIQHMMIAEKGSLAYVKKKTSYPDSLKKAGFSYQWRKLLWIGLGMAVMGYLINSLARPAAVRSTDHS